ncbi:MAG: hypothetical protein A2X58_04095 [Nitrospirae bacterium GWC2_56_14]|nr:MAG: hypothetical protein A2X58_04095 [Nitrospirae bacterium GWC2_56_14]
MLQKLFSVSGKPKDRRDKRPRVRRKKAATREQILQEFHAAEKLLYHRMIPSVQLESLRYGSDNAVLIHEKKPERTIPAFFIFLLQ